MDKIRVFIADWQVLFREGVHFILSGEEDIEVIGEASDNEEAFSAIEKNPPKIAILNANRGQLSGFEITRRLKRDFPSVSVILIIDSANEEQLLAAMKSGASACLTKEVNPNELVDTIRQVVQGNHPISDALLQPAIAAQVIEEFDDFTALNEQVNNLLARLLPGETAILQRIADQNPMEQIAQALGISQEAVRQNLDTIRNKLVANDHSRDLIETAQSKLTSIISRITKPKRADKPTADYITKDKLTTYKETLRERLEAFLKELA